MYLNKNVLYYRKIQNALDCESYSDTVRAEKAIDIVHDFEESLDVDTFQFMYSNDNNRIRLEIHKINFNTSNIVTQKFKSILQHPVVRGDILNNIKQNINWLCIESRPLDYLFYTGTLRQCDYEMRWQDETGKIINKWCCLTTASQYNSGENADKQLTIGYNQLLIYMPLDADTIKLKSDKRFFIDSDKTNPKPYRLTRVDTVSMAYNGQGCIVLLVTECQYNSATDSIENMLCDYISNIETNIYISYYGLNEISIDCKKTFTANTETTIVNWEVENYSGDDISIETDLIDSHKCKVLIANNDALIGQNYNLMCVNSNGNIGKIEFKITGEL